MDLRNSFQSHINFMPFLISIGLLLVYPGSSHGIDLSQFVLFPRCTATALNRTVPVGPLGAYSLDNIPADQGLFRVRVNCIGSGVTLQGQTVLLDPIKDGTTLAGVVTLGAANPIADTLDLMVSKDTLTVVGDAAQLTVTAFFDNGNQADVTNAPDTVYTISNPNTATVSSTGLVTAVSSGPVIVSASKDGVIATLLLQVNIGASGDTD